MNITLPGWSLLQRSTTISLQYLRNCTATSLEENWIQDSATGVQVFAWNRTFLSEGIAERVCPTTDTEINIQELTLRAENPGGHLGI